jgi:hypothetical protein
MVLGCAIHYHGGRYKPKPKTFCLWKKDPILHVLEKVSQSCFKGISEAA